MAEIKENSDEDGNDFEFPSNFESDMWGYPANVSAFVEKRRHLEEDEGRLV